MQHADPFGFFFFALPASFLYLFLNFDDRHFL